MSARDRTLLLFYGAFCSLMVLITVYDSRIDFKNSAFTPICKPEAE